MTHLTHLSYSNSWSPICAVSMRWSKWYHLHLWWYFLFLVSRQLRGNVSLKSRLTVIYTAPCFEKLLFALWSNGCRQLTICESIYLFRLQFFLRPPKKRCAAKNLVLAAAVFFCGIGLWQFACLSSPWLSACNHPWDRVAQCCGYGTYMCIGVIYNEIPSEIRWFFAPNGQSRVWRRCFGAKSQILFEMVQKGPDRPKGSKWPKTLRLTILVPFGPL